MKNRNALKRMVKIYRLLEQNAPISYTALTALVNRSLDYPVCKFTIEKDVFNLRMDFDIEIGGNHYGISLLEKADITSRVLAYLDLEETPTAPEKWIDNKKSKPEIGDEYLVVWNLEDNDYPVTTCMEWFPNDKAWIDLRGNGKNMDKSVLYWMPLPAPPENINPKIYIK